MDTFTSPKMFCSMSLNSLTPPCSLLLLNLLQPPLPFLLYLFGLFHFSALFLSLYRMLVSHLLLQPILNNPFHPTLNLCPLPALCHLLCLLVCLLLLTHPIYPLSSPLRLLLLIQQKPAPSLHLHPKICLLVLALLLQLQINLSSIP